MTSIARFVDDVPRNLLLALLEKHDVRPPDFEPSETAKNIASAIEQTLRLKAPGQLSAFQATVDEISLMGSEAGSLAIAQADFDIPETLPSARARALWLMLTQVDAYAHAENILFANNHRGKRDWTPFQGRSGVDLLGDEDAIRQFEDRLRIILDSRNVEVEIFKRAGHRPGRSLDRPESTDHSLQIMIYSEERPHSELRFENSRVVNHSRCPVREAAIVYEPESGVMECVAKHREKRIEIVEAFSTNMLRETTCAPVPLRSYTLEPLRHPLTFEFDPAEGIEQVAVTSMMLVPIDSSDTRVTIDRSLDSKDDIWSIITRRLGAGALIANYRLQQAQIVIRYRAGESRRLRSMPIRITPPMRSNIQEHTDFEAMISRRYLPRWGLIVE